MQVTITAGWNRWAHSTRIVNQPLLDDGDGWVAITLDVPADAAVLDFVLKGEHGATDDNNKRGFHLPVAGGTGVVPKLHIAHAAVEMAPIAKVRRVVCRRSHPLIF
jgi:hypothetical protein